MSRVFQFRSSYLHFAGIIPPCITLERKYRLVPVGLHRPWATALSRLLRERGVKKSDLMAYGLKRAGTISDVLHQPKQPDVRTLQNLADVFTAYDRRSDGGRADAPPVPLWEFFVSDDQAELLRTHQAQRDALVKPPPTTEEEREFAEFQQFRKWKQQDVETRAMKMPRLATQKVKR